MMRKIKYALFYVLGMIYMLAITTALNSSATTGKEEAIYMVAVVVTIAMTFLTLGSVIYFFVENWSEKK